ncbi:MULTISPECIES: 30S ribosomal protein S6 [Ruminococcus]|uniref:Small ribosomal subunit protein bS6 n=1 Tax=Ruminococcus champanellensis (strain DSM 18848 / JCM 17042 / KCTC 15320 / 18P13) TaxID=213810 RepID=D4LEZ5_RUMC1|nr:MULTISPECIES: 30S ribosomal protein S6 [Ruminococcus]MED9891142.1 30S ribosomal protein S6 [Ruminococcus champanellensis]CBL18190.1 SSU ribosomal protein S6P [Ruminococcus champanellensis 18P13 = JCM 17042]CDD53578.1 30S ribosomal protein S6 [Ruminococcus sp. CAG:379]
MAKVNAKYEAMVVFSLAKGEDAVKELIEKFKAQIEENATLESVDESWGKRKLAYPINDELDGYYVIYTFESTPAYPAEFTRKVNITDGVLRSLVTVK